MQDKTLAQQVLEHVNSPNYQPVKPKVIAKQLKLPSDDYQELRRVIKRLVKQGRLNYGASHLVLPVAAPASQKKRRDKTSESRKPREEVYQPRKAAETGLESQATDEETPRRKRRDQPAIIGRFRRAAAGFGFVRLSPIERAAWGIDEDIFIPERKTLDASSGDRVRVRVRKSRKPERRWAGEIVEVVERETHQFVGSYLEREGEFLVQVDGSVFAHAIPVGDPGAKSVNEGDKVVIEMVRFPTHWDPGEAVITELLGARGAPGVDTLTIIREYGLPDVFPEDVLASAREQAAKFDEQELGDRLDLTGIPTVTIDPVDARDFDDAISLERLENGNWQLGVHIADVAHFVPPRTPLDQEAKNRATSVYLPDRVIPMLPEIISNNLASLQPNRVRYTKTAFIEFTPEGMPVHSEFHNSAIRSKRRFTYEEVDDFLADREAWQSRLAPEIFQLLDWMHELAMTLRRRRLDAGSIELTLPEIKIDLDKQGRVEGAHKVEQTVSHQIIEEFMLAANQAVAQRLADLEMPFLRRVHGAPDPRKLKALTQFVRELGIPCESLESRFETKRVVALVEHHPEQQAVNYAILRSMQKAVYSPQEEGHYALNFKNYCHFTSPIRRYPDLTVHRLIGQLAAKRSPSAPYEQLVELGEHCSEREQRAEAAERELVKIKLLTFMSQRIGHRMKAVITGVEPFGFFAQGIELPAEGLISVQALQDDYYDYDEASRSLVGRRAGNRFRLGDVIEVEVLRVDIDRRQLDFRLIRREKSAPIAEVPGRREGRRDGPKKSSRQEESRGGKRGKAKASRRGGKKSAPKAGKKKRRRG